jgi:hypothetical protein
MAEIQVIVLQGKDWTDVVNVYGDKGSKPATVQYNWADIKNDNKYVGSHTVVRGSATTTGFLRNQTGQVIARVFQVP